MNSSTSREFQDKGVISRITVDNFVTYTRAVVTPGRGLNVIIGPNGTGKSTIVAAIVLGLGGNPAVLGKKVKAMEFIRAGAQEAKIEIILKESEGRTITVGRTFDNRGHNTWLINGSQVSAGKFKEVVNSFNIQVDNLCQFLPQDKVADFSKMGPIDLLLNTERSVGDGTLFETHEKLKTYRVTQRNLEAKLKTKEESLSMHKQKKSDLDRFVEGINNRKAMKKRLDSLKQKIAWTKYDIQRTLLTTAKKAKEKAEEKREELRAKLEPANREIESVSSQIREIERKVESFKTSIVPHYKKFQQDLEKIKNIKDSIKVKEQECKRMIEEEKNRDQEIAQANKIKSKFENDLRVMIDEIGTLESLDLKLTEVTTAMNNKRRSHNGYVNQLSENQIEQQRIARQISSRQSEKQTAEDVASEKLKRLRSCDNDAYEGTIWLRQNINKFRGKVHEPMMLNIQPKHLKYAKYFESTINVRDLCAFVCEDVNDMNLLLRYLREEKKLIVNVIHSDPHEKVNMTPNIPIENIKHLGFEDYLLAFIDAPATILKYLVKTYNLHNIPLGSEAVESRIEEIPQQITRFFSTGSAYTLTRSKYSGEKATSISAVRKNDLLSTIIDTAKIERLENEIAGFIRNRGINDEDRRELERKVQEENQEVDRLKAEITAISQEINQIKNLKHRLSVAEEKVRTLESGRKSPELINSQMKLQAQAYVVKQLKYYEQMNNVFRESINITSKCEQFMFEVRIKKRLLARLKNESQDLRKELKIAEEDVQHAQKKVEPLHQIVINLFEEAKATTNGILPNTDSFKSINATFAKLPTGLDEMETERQKALAKIHCLGNNQDGDQIVRDHGTAVKMIETLENEIKDLNVEYNENKREIEELKNQWLIPLQTLVNRINDNFQKYFKMMDCNGEVSLEPGENPSEFKDYGLKIRVKFRSSDELQELTRERQSGGERAVTTGIFMISLQELSNVPFRCVDEINQGMDATNERKVFQLIVKMTSSKNSSQYFLLTPKLLPNLEYGEHVTVHCVFNGPFVIPHEQWNVNRYCEMSARKRERRQKQSG